MKPRVLPRVLSAVFAAALCLSIAPGAAAQSRRADRTARPAASPLATEEDDGQESRPQRHHHVRVGEGSPTVTISDTAYVAKGEIHQDDIVCILGKVRVEGEVRGDIVVIMGTLDISGTVRGSVVGIMSPTHIEDGAVIEDELVSIGGPLTKAPGSRIDGEEVKLNFLDAVPFLRGGWSGLWKLLYLIKLAKLAGLFLMLLLVTALVPHRLSVVAAAFPNRWPMAILAGLVAYCATFVLCFLLAITLIGIPLAIALWFAAKTIKWIGLASILFLLGHTLARNVWKRELSHFAAVLGGFAIYAIISLVPICGGIFSMCMSVLSLGIAILTRFGADEGWRRQNTVSAPGPLPPPAPTGPPPAYSPTPGGGA